MSDPSIVVLRERLTHLFSDVLHVEVPSADSDLFDTGALDSLAFVELLVQLERQFGVKTSVDDLELEHFQSIARIADFVNARQVPRAGTRVSDHAPASAV